MQSVHCLIKGTSLDRCSGMKALGVIFSSNLYLDKHIHMILGSSERLLELFAYTSQTGLSDSILVLLFKSVVWQVLEYASVVWTPYQTKYISKSQRIQRRFVRSFSLRASSWFFVYGCFSCGIGEDLSRSGCGLLCF